jgi:HEAT repeat protein
MRSEHEARIRQLIGRLGHADPVVRIQAAGVLGVLGSAARGAVPALVGLLDQGDAQDRRLAALTLGYIGAGEAVGPLRHALEDADEVVRRLAAAALEKIVPGATRVRAA